jgi:hypothetical protein
MEEVMTGKQKRDPKDYVIGPDATISDIDLDEESFTAPDGSRLTEAKAEQLAAAALAEKRKANLIPGRKSLGKDGSHSPVVQFRTPRKAEAQDLADELGVSISELARSAFDLLLDQAASRVRRNAYGKPVASLEDLPGVVRVDASGREYPVSDSEAVTLLEAIIRKDAGSSRSKKA